MCVYIYIGIHTHTSIVYTRIIILVLQNKYL